MIPAIEAKRQPERQIERDVRRRGQRRHVPAIDHVDVGGLQPRRYIGLFQALEEALMKLPIGLHFTLETVVLNRVLGQLVGQAILPGEGGGQPVAVRDGEVVLDLGLIERFPLFIRELLTNVGELLVQRQHLGPLGAKLLGQRSRASARAQTGGYRDPS